MSKVLNFDLFMQEKNRETIKVTVLGKDYEIKAEVPAIVPVMMARAENAKDNALATRMIMKAADIMFGVDAVDEMCGNGMAASELAMLVQKIFQIAQNGGSEEDDDAQELSDEDSRKTTSSGKQAKK